MEWMSVEQVASRPHGGITDVIDLTRDRRDRGGNYLVVERGTRFHDLTDWTTSTGRLVATRADRKRAARYASKLQERADRHVVGARYHVVERSSVRLREKSSDYGAYSGDVTA
jgi:hypothetical protein